MISRQRLISMATTAAIGLALIVVVALLWAGISYAAKHYVSAGTVVERSYVPSHYENYLSYEYAYEDCHTNSSGTTSCESVYHWVPRIRWVPDRWNVLVEGNCVSDSVGLTKCDQTWHTVSEQEYEVLREGVWYGPTPSPSYSWR